MRLLAIAQVACVLLAIRAGGQPAPENRLVRMGTMSETYARMNAGDAQVAMQLWIDTIVRKIGGQYTGVSVVFKDVAQAVEAVRKGELEVVNLPSVDFLQARAQVDLEPVAVGVFADGRAAQEFLLLTRRDTGAQTLADLRGGKLLVNRLDWRTARLWVDIRLNEAGQPNSRAHFGEIRQVDGTSKQVLPVFFGQADACIVTVRGLATLAELNPQLARQLMPLARSPEYLLYLVTLVPGLDEEVRRDFMDMALDLHRDPTGRQMLTLFGLERIRRFKAEDLDSLEELAAEYERLTGEKVE